MRGLARLITVVAALVLLWPGAAMSHHVELPSELEEGLPEMPDGTLPQPAGSDADVHSDNMFLLSNFAQPFPGFTEAPAGSDLAFWGKTAVAGIYDRPGGIRLLDISDPRSPVLLGQAACPGTQGDVSVWKDLVFMSVDSPRRGPACGEPGAPSTQYAAGQAYEGIRIFSIADKANPQQIGFVNTDCGSHTHTLVPDPANDRVFIYVLSYPLGTPATNCSAESHRKISVVEVPLSEPTQARVVSTPDVSPAIGCHDVTVFTARKLAAAACLTESQMWDISDPAHPRVVAHIANPAMNIHHSSAFAWDGNTLVLGDEMGGAAAAAGCLDPHLPLGALWFYDVSDPAAPVVKGRYNLPEEEQQEETLLCTAHNFNTVPLTSGRDVLVSAWYNGGTTVLDFTDPSAARQLGYYVAKEPITAANWSSYWYRGFIWANNFDASYVPSDPRSRGFDAMVIADKELKRAEKLPRLNPQTQEPF